MFWLLIILIISLIALIKSADLFVDCAAKVALFHRWSPMLIGMVVVGFGTSAPELLVSVMGALSGQSGIAIGNVVGSNIANIGLILGITLLFKQIPVSKDLIKSEFRYLLGLCVVLMVMMWNQVLGRIEGLVLLGLFSFFIYRSIKESSDEKGASTEQVVEKNHEDEITPSRYKVLRNRMGLALLFLLGSSKLLVWTAVKIAQSAGVSELVIGLTIVAVGTSLPELASSIAAARKGQTELALGNVIGSNLFNGLLVLGSSAFIMPLEVPKGGFPRDWFVMTLFTVGL